MFNTSSVVKSIIALPSFRFDLENHFVLNYGEKI